MTQFQSLLQNKTGLGHGAFCSVNQQDNAVDHLQNTLHFAAEVSVAGGVDDIDLVVLVVDGSVLGQNGDAAFTLQVAGVHNTVLGCLVFTVDTALLQQLINQGGFTMVNVGNNGNITDIFLRYHI